MPAIGEGRLLAELEPSSAVAIMEAAGIGDGPLTLVELRQLGGALRHARTEGALTTLDGAFALVAVGAAPNPAGAAAVKERIAEVVRATAPADLGRSIANLRTGRSVAPGALTQANARTLRRIQRERDPEARLIRAMRLTEQ